jgi:hypothetical protein
MQKARAKPSAYTDIQPSPPPPPQTPLNQCPFHPIPPPPRPPDLLDEVVAEVALEAHREHRTGTLPGPPPGPPPPKPRPLDPLPGVKGATDVFGQVGHGLNAGSVLTQCLLHGMKRECVDTMGRRCDRHTCSSSRLLAP